MKRIIIPALLFAALAASAQGTAATTQQTDGKGTIRAYVMHDESIDWDALTATKTVVNSRAGRVVTVTLPPDSLASLRKVTGVTYVQTATEVHEQLNLAREDARVDAVHNALGLPQGYTGKGVIVGIVDSGIDYTHPAFRNPDGTLRIKRVWELGTTSSRYGSTPPQGYGTEFKTQQNILASEADNELRSHGTHVLGIAAGGRTNTYSSYCGVAPEADIVVVALDRDASTGENNVYVSDALAYIYAYAEEVGKPCVVNISLGSNIGPHDGTSLFDVFADNIQGPGRLLVGATGNYGGYNFHLTKDFSSTDDAPLQTLLDYQYTLSSVKTGGDIDIWGSEGMEYEVTLLTYNTFNHAVSGETLVFSPANEAAGTTETLVSEATIGRNASGKFLVNAEISPLNGKRHVSLQSAITSVRTNNAIGIRIRPLTPGTVNIWADHTKIDLKSGGEEGFSGPTTESTVAEIGGTGKRIISVGAYCTRDNYTPEGQHTAVSTGEKLGHLFSHSGSGATADGRMKPDVCAPGSVIISTISSADISGGTPKAFSFISGARSYSYGYIQGTSMASPFVAGTVALCLEACPTLSPEQIREVLQSSARQDQGIAKVDAFASVQAAKLYTGISTVEGGENREECKYSYNLTGQRVNPTLSRGIIISGGRKVINSPL